MTRSVNGHPKWLRKTASVKSKEHNRKPKSSGSELTHLVKTPEDPNDFFLDFSVRFFAYYEGFQKESY